MDNLEEINFSKHTLSQDRISKKTKTWAQPPLTHTVYFPHLPDLSMLFSADPDSFA